METQPLFYYATEKSKYCSISFDGVKYYGFKRENVHPEGMLKRMDYLIYHTDIGVMKCEGHYDKEKKEIHFIYDPKVYKQYQGIITRQKLERVGQIFFNSEQQGKGKKMSLKELEGIKSNRVDLKDIPMKITPCRIETEVKEDPADKVECLYANFYWMVGKDEMVTTLKYRPFHIKILIARMNELKIKDVKDYVNKLWTHEKEPFGTLGYGKYLPAPEES